MLQTKDGKLADTAMAQVTLAEIPFVSLRHGLPVALLAGHASFNDTVLAARTALAPPQLVIDPTHRRINAGGIEVTLPPAELALLAVFARQILTGGEALPAPPKDGTDEEWAKRFLREYRGIVGPMAGADSTERALKNGMDGDYFSQRKSKLERLLRRALGPAAMHYRIGDGGSRPRKYRLGLAAEAIRFAADVALREGI